VKKEEILMQFGNRIRERRTALGISQEKLAETTGFHRTYIGMVERGERNISLRNISVFAKAFNLNLSQLLEGINEC
jgi:transcriptional regulator with XRE-family HTH domain